MQQAHQCPLWSGWDTLPVVRLWLELEADLLWVLSLEISISSTYNGQMQGNMAVWPRINMEELKPIFTLLCKQVCKLLRLTSWQHWVWANGQKIFVKIQFPTSLPHLKLKTFHGTTAFFFLSFSWNLIDHFKQALKSDCLFCFDAAFSFIVKTFLGLWINHCAESQSDFKSHQWYPSWCFESKVWLTNFSISHLESAPSWKIKPRNVTLFEDQEYTLPCDAIAFPEPAHSWSHNGHLVVSSNPVVVGNNLVFSSAKASHSGWYTCTASNYYGSISSSVYVEVVSGM